MVVKLRVILYLCFLIAGFSCSSDNSAEENSSDCKISDGTYSATVEYHNPETSYDATYTLDVDVEECQVTVIHFPNGGYIDSDHITPSEIDENGDASVEGEEGKTYDVHIDN